ncbi:cell division protein FtsX [Maribellus mangrovi]|uniref:cell division protein FtsX n=1 Tax=Maribellus mangrovi TaxID=3133146 RepID=UPI0030EE697E
MKQKKAKKIKKRFWNSWITSLVNITLILILLGLLSFVVLNAHQLSNYVREQIGLTLVLNDDLKEVEIIRLEKTLSLSEYVKLTRYIDKETAAKELTEELGEDFTGFLGQNPLFSSIEIKLYASYTNSDSLKILEQRFLNYPEVKEVYFEKNIATLINDNVKRISLLLLIVSGLLTFIFFGLINNTIRLLIYSQRFIINTMQMVGASKNYIRQPFLKRSLLLGGTGALLANLVLLAGIYTYKTELFDQFGINDMQIIPIVVLSVFVLGFVISLLSTWLVLNKFLRLKFDELFY